MSWNTICTLSDILPYGGRAAMVDGEQVAIFRIPGEGRDNLYAIANYDPFSQANVISRGLVGCSEGRLNVASPVYKHHYCLSSGICLEDSSVQLKTWNIQLDGETVKIESTLTTAA